MARCLDLDDPAARILGPVDAGDRKAGKVGRRLDGGEAPRSRVRDQLESLGGEPRAERRGRGAGRMGEGESRLELRIPPDGLGHRRIGGRAGRRREEQHEGEGGPPVESGRETG